MNSIEIILLLSFFFPVKDEINRRGGAMKVPITKELLKEARNSSSRYKEYLEHQKQAKERAKREAAENCEREKRAAAVNDQRKGLEKERGDIIARIGIADKHTEDGNTQLQAALSCRILERSKVIAAQELIDASLKRRKQLKSDFDVLEAKLKRFE